MSAEKLEWMTGRIIDTKTHLVDATDPDRYRYSTCNMRPWGGWKPQTDANAQKCKTCLRRFAKKEKQ